MSEQQFQTADAVYQADASALAGKRALHEERTAASPPLLRESSGEAPIDIPAGTTAATFTTSPTESVLEDASASMPSAEWSITGGRPHEQPSALDSNSEPEQETVGVKRIGLALSGGGIRSATFSLGVLQRMAMRDTLKEIDMLSTVSGGGYMGAFLSAWIHRSPSPQDVWNQLKRCPENNQTEPPQVQWLRRYSNYLTPRVGALSLDALTVAATYLRNVALNMCVLVAFVAAIVVLPLFFVPPVQVLLDHASLARAGTAIFGLIALVACFIQLSPKSRQRWPRVTRPVLVYATVIAPGFLTALFGAAFLVSVDDSAPWVRACLFTMLGMVAIMAVTQAALSRLGPVSSSPSVSSFRFAVYAPATAVVVAVGFLMLAGLNHGWHSRGATAENATLMLVFGAPLLVGVVAASVTLWIGLLGRDYPEMYREWWSRVGGAAISVGAVWIAWCALATYVPMYLPAWLASFGRWTNHVIAAGWIGSLATAVGLVRSLSGNATSGKTLPKRASIAAILATVVLVMLVIAIACGVFALMQSITQIVPQGNGFVDVTNWVCCTTHVPAPTSAFVALHFLPAAWMVLLASAVTAVVFGWRVDINRFSLHDMYKNRLIRCYLGASNQTRKPNLFSGFDPNDDIALADLAPLQPVEPTPVGGSPARPAPAPANDIPLNAEPQRPFPIFNTALNLVHGSELAWQERKSALFVLTPTFCGYNLAPATGDKPLFAGPCTQTAGAAPEQAFRPTALYADNASRNDRSAYRTAGPHNLPANIDNGERTGFTIGMAMATSGAAVSPNMGANTQPALAMLMTFFNIRLGRWCPNPGKNDWRRASPRSNLAWLLAEASGNTNERRSFVYLSDGGHFENTAVYELVRRRCSHIVMVDAGADPTRAFEDLGNLIRKVRVDLGAEIELKLNDLYALKTGRSTAGFVRGQVTYATNNERATGKILLIKPTLGKDKLEPADVYNYARGDETFPQQTTLDQWFDESQFEAYRCLGSFLTQAAFDANPGFFA